MRVTNCIRYDNRDQILPGLFETTKLDTTLGTVIVIATLSTFAYEISKQININFLTLIFDKLF